MNTKALAILEVVGMPEIGSVQSLEKGRVLSIPRAGELSVYCLCGALWVTGGQSLVAGRGGQSPDIVIRAGETKLVRGQGPIVISAFEDAKLWVG